MRPYIGQYLRVEEDISHDTVLRRGYCRHLEGSKPREDVVDLLVLVFVWDKLEVDLFRPPLLRKLVEQNNGSWVRNFDGGCELLGTAHVLLFVMPCVPLVRPTIYAALNHHDVRRLGDAPLADIRISRHVGRRFLKD